MDVSENNGTPKSSILIGISSINHPFWGTTIFGNTHISHETCTSSKTQDSISLAATDGSADVRAALRSLQAGECDDSKV